jgi:Flp pilus assembly protein TadG
MRRAGQRGARRQRGIAAAELALVMPVLVLLLIAPLYLGRVFWHYTAIQYAAQDAARYLSRVPAAEMGNPTRAGTVADVAQAIVAQELAELAPGVVPHTFLSDCNGGACSGTTPTLVHVHVSQYMQDVFFPRYTLVDYDLHADVTYPYVGQ